MSKKSTIFALFLLLLLAYQNSFYQNLKYGNNTAPIHDASFFQSRADHISNGNYVTESSTTTYLDFTFEAYPPGYAILLANLYVVPSLDSFEVWIVYKFYFITLFILLGFIVGKSLKNTNLGLITSIYMSLPVFVSASYHGKDSINLNFTPLFPNLTGSITDIVFIFLTFYFIQMINYRFDKSTNSFFVLLAITLATFGISHISRYIMLFISLNFFILIHFIYFRVFEKQKVNSENLIISFISVGTLIAIYIFYYVANVTSFDLFALISARLPSLIAELVSPQLFSLFSFLIISILTFITARTREDRKLFSIAGLLPYKVFNYVYLVLIILIVMLTSFFPELIGTGIYGPFYLFPSSEIFSININSILYFQAIFSLLMAYTGFRFLLSSRQGSILSGILISGLFIYLFSMLINLQPSRMNIFIYIFPFLFSLAIYSLLPILDKFRQYSNFLPILFIVSLFFSHNLLISYNHITSTPSITGLNYYDDRIRNSEVISNIYVSNNLLEFIDSSIYEEEVVFSTPTSQLIIAAYTQSSPINSDEIADIFNRPFLDDSFNSYNCRYLVIGNDDTRNSEDRVVESLNLIYFSLEYFDSLPYLDLVYMNNLGERVYQFNGVSN